LRALAAGTATGLRESAYPGFERVRERFNLSPFERDAFALLVASEVDPELAVMDRTVAHFLAIFAPLCADPRIALELLGPAGHLVRSGLVEVAGDGPFVTRTLRASSAVWPRALGLSSPQRFVIAEPSREALVLSEEVATAVADAVTWARTRPTPVIAIVGRTGSGRDAVAASIAGALGFASLAIDTVTDVRAIVCDAVWFHAAVIVRGPVEPSALAVLGRELGVPLIAIVDGDASRTLAAMMGAPVYRLALPAMGPAGLARIWRHYLGETALDVDQLARRVSSPAAIVSALALARSNTPTEEDLDAALRHPDDDTHHTLLRLLPRDVTLDDVVASPVTRRELAMVVGWARHGTARPGAGLVCMFCGPPGTGKTMAARALARELGVEILAIELAEVVSKYIGETEKNLERVFRVAQARNALLFFDEADALFGKRTEVVDARDRYANIETSYLLQRLEAHPGVVVLATNRRESLDAAFLRRIQAVVDFASPELAEREELWRRYGASGLDVVALSKFVLTGAEIRNASATAELLAALDAEPVEMRHAMIAVWRELRKVGRVVMPDLFGEYRAAIFDYTELERGR